MDQRTGASWSGTFESMRDYRTIPSNTLEDLIAYVIDGRVFGHFVTAVVTNDLVGAFKHADLPNIRAMWAICTWLYNRAPQQSFGSPAAVAAWRDGGGLKGVVVNDPVLAAQVVEDWRKRAVEGTVLG